MLVPYNIKSIYLSLAESFEFDRGFFATLITLFVNPRVVIDTYLSGNTKRFSSPFRYFVTFLTLGTLISVVVSQLSPEVTRPDSPSKMIFPYLLILLLLLFFSTLNYLLFRSARNFVEHLVIGTYEASQVVAIIFLSIPFELVDKSAPVLLIGPSMVLYLLWFNYKNFGGRKSILLSLLSLVIIVALMAYIGFLIYQKPGKL